MGGGVFMKNHNHNHHHRHEEVPKGCFAIMVGREEDCKEKFVIPLDYVNHPLFAKLLEDAEEVYGYDHEGLITLPCDVGEFREVQDKIDREYESRRCHFQHHHRHHHHHHGHHLHCNLWSCV